MKLVILSLLIVNALSAFVWVTDPVNFPACPTACGSDASTVSRTVECQDDSDNSVVNDDQCDAGTKPDATSACGAVEACDWDITPAAFPACPTACGTDASTVSRAVTCQSASGTTIDDALCEATTAKPATSEDCAATDACAYSWNVNPAEFPACPTACGTDASTVSRTVTCQDQDGTAASDEASCTETKPAETSDCAATDACTYSWNSSATCPTLCGNAASTPANTVTCVTQDGLTVDDSNCTGTAPTNPLDCAATDDCVYTWNSSATCPTACGSAASTPDNTVTCQTQDGTVSDNANCTGDAPTNPLDCAATAACPSSVANLFMGIVIACITLLF